MHFLAQYFISRWDAPLCGALVLLNINCGCKVYKVLQRFSHLLPTKVGKRGMIHYENYQSFFIWDVNIMNDLMNVISTKLAIGKRILSCLRFYSFDHEH